MSGIPTHKFSSERHDHDDPVKFRGSIMSERRGVMSMKLVELINIFS